MIQVTITKSDNQLTAVFHGHAGHDKVGKDIVCAGVSALFYALVLGINKIAPKTVTMSDTTITISNITNETKGAMMAIFEGLKAIEHDYPECLKITFTVPCPFSA